MAKKDVFALIEQTKEFIYSSFPENRLNESERKIFEIATQRKVLANVSSEEDAEIKSLVENNPKYTFYSGEEEDFLDFIDNYNKEYGNKADEKANCIMVYIIYNSMNNLDINKLLECAAKSQKFGKNDFFNFVCELIFLRISFEELENGVKGENLRIINKYYVEYARVRRIPYDEILTRYLVCADRIIEQNADNKEELIKQNNDILMAVLLDAISAVTSRLVKRLDSEGKRRIVACIDMIMPRIDLNIEFDYFNGNKVILRDLLAHTLLIGCANSIEGFDNLTKEFLKSNEQAVYRGVHNIDIYYLELIAACGDIDRMREFVAREDVSLCDNQKYEILRNDDKYPISHGIPQDYITPVVPNPNFEHGDLLELLCNSKVKMLNIKVIYKAMIGGCLNPIELKYLLDYIVEKRILVYDCIDDNVTVVADPFKRLNELKQSQK